MRAFELWQRELFGLDGGAFLSDGVWALSGELHGAYHHCLVLKEGFERHGFTLLASGDTLSKMAGRIWAKLNSDGIGQAGNLVNGLKKLKLSGADKGSHWLVTPLDEKPLALVVGLSD